MQKIIQLFFFLLISGCASMGTVNTNNLQNKLNQADNLLYNQGRPLPAERLIFEAMTEYRQSNDHFGLANAFRDYADLLKSSAVAKNAVPFMKTGFRDPEVNMENRLEKADEYLTQSIEQYSLASVKASQDNQYSKLLNIYFNMAANQDRLGNTVEMCTLLGKALAVYDDAIRQNPSSPIPSPRQGTESAADYLKTLQTRNNCEP